MKAFRVSIFHSCIDTYNTVTDVKLLWIKVIKLRCPSTKGNMISKLNVLGRRLDKKTMFKKCFQLDMLRLKPLRAKHSPRIAMFTPLCLSYTDIYIKRVGEIIKVKEYKYEFLLMVYNPLLS